MPIECAIFRYFKAWHAIGFDDDVARRHINGFDADIDGFQENVEGDSESVQFDGIQDFKLIRRMYRFTKWLILRG